MNHVILALIFLGTAAAMIWRNRSRWSNIMGGVLIGASFVMLAEVLVPAILDWLLNR